MKFIEATTLCALKIRRWSGEAKAERTDITLGEGGDIPPPQLLELGRKRLIDPKTLNPFLTIRKSAERNVLEVGTRFMGGFAFPDERSDQVCEKLNQLAASYEAETQRFLNVCSQKLQEWRDANSQYAHTLQRPITLEEIERKFEFSYSLYKLDPVQGHAPDEEEIAGGILHEIGMECAQIAKRLSERKQGISGDNLGKMLLPMMEKLNALSFGNGRLLRVLDEFQALKQSIPSRRLTSETPVFGQVLCFLSAMSDEDRIEDVLSGKYSVASVFRVDLKAHQEPQSAVPTAAFF